MHKKIIHAALLLSISLTASCFPAEHPNDSNTADINDANLAIVCVSVANLRGRPAHSSELCDQELMGYPLTLQKKQDNWYLVETEYKYPGWMTESSFHKVSSEELKQWKECEKVRIVKVLATILSEPNTFSQPLTFVTMNALLKKVDAQPDGWVKVQTPDGKTGFLQTQDCTDAAAKKIPKEKLGQSVVETAKMMMGIPYLWGGRASTACDCSGFSSTVFRANGILIARDSRAQAVQGTDIKYKKDFSNVMPGDLIFFGKEKISHVAISLGGKDFIHQSGCVHITSFDPNSPYYEESYGKKIKAIRRFF